MKYIYGQIPKDMYKILEFLAISSFAVVMNGPYEPAFISEKQGISFKKR